MENSIPDLNCMTSFQKLEWLVLLAYCELKKGYENEYMGM